MRIPLILIIQLCQLEMGEKGKKMADRKSSSAKVRSDSSAGKASSRRNEKSQRVAKDRDIEKRRRNVQSADRSRQRKTYQLLHDQNQVFEIAIRIDELERESQYLTEELSAPPRYTPRSTQHLTTGQSTNSQPDRPSWFGDPF